MTSLDLNISQMNHVHTLTPVPWISVLGAFAYSRKAPITFVVSVRLPVCLSVRLPKCINAAPTGRISVKFDSGTFIKIWLKSGKKCQHITWRHKYVLFLPATLNRHERAIFVRNANRLYFVRPSACISAAPIGRIYVKFYVRDFYETLSTKY